MSDLEIIELVIRRVAVQSDSRIRPWLEKIADELAKMAEERKDRKDANS